MIEWGSVAQAVHGTDNAISTLERGDRAFFPLSFPWFQYLLTIRNKPPFPLAYTMSNTAVIWLSYEGCNSRHGDYPGIHGRDRNVSAVPEGMGDPTSSTSRCWTPRRYSLLDSPVGR